MIQAIEMYKSGKAVAPICKELKMDGATLNRFLKELGIKRSMNEAIRRGKSGGALVKHDALDVLTSEALYWIGFLYADGHIEKSRPRICLTLTEGDKLHLQKFADFFGTGLNLIQTVKGGIDKSGYENKPSYRVAFSSQKIYECLLGLGFTHRKTWNVVPHYFLKNSRDFWRGVVDGDGWIYTVKYKGVERYPALGLCGHVNTLTEFISFLNNNGVATDAKPLKKKTREFLWQMDLHTNVAKKAAELLYKDAPVYLNRKYEKYLSWINPDNTPLGVFHTSSEENCTALSD